MRRDRLAVDGGDEHALVAAGAHALLSARRQRKCASPAATCERSGSSAGKKDQQVGIVAPQPGDQLAVAQNHFGIGRARQHPRRRSQNLRP